MQLSKSTRPQRQQQQNKAELLQYLYKSTEALTTILIGIFRLCSKILISYQLFLCSDSTTVSNAKISPAHSSMKLWVRRCRSLFVEAVFVLVLFVLLIWIAHFFTPWWTSLSRFIQAVARILGLCKLSVFFDRDGKFTPRLFLEFCARSIVMGHSLSVNSSSC